MIEESGENWFYEVEHDSPTIEVTVSRHREVERRIERKRKAKPKDLKRKKQPFGFAQALPKRKGKR